MAEQNLSNSEQPNIALSTILHGLNPQQKLAVQSVEGPILIVAGPGSGKTRVLTHRIAYLIEYGAVDPYRILAVTFTNKAAKEMKTRLEALIGPRATQLTVGTFHSLGVRMLRQDADKLGLDRDFAIYDDEDQLGLVKQALKDLNFDEKQYAPRAMLSIISKAKSALLEPAGFAEQVETYFEEIGARVYNRYANLLAANRAVDFDDLIRLPIKLMTENPQARDKWQRRYDHVLVDEYQDTNHAQYIMVKLLADRSRNICVVGDPDQSIYGWRQADITNILNFERDYPNARVVLLEQNYRSTQTILDTAQHVITPNTQRKDKKLWTENERGVKVTVYEAYNEEDEAAYVAREISRIVRRGELRWRDFAVMYRMNSQSRAIEQAFLGYNVPYQVIGGVRFYSRKEIKDVLSVLRVVLNPFDSVSLARSISNTPLGKGIGSKTLAELERIAGERGIPPYAVLQLLDEQDDDGSPLSRAQFNTAGATAKMLALVRMLDSFIGASKEMNLLDLFDHILEQTNYADFMSDGSNEGEERWQNIMELRSVIGNYSELTPPEGLARFLEDVALIADIDTIQDEKDAVTLITLHTAKGLEYPIVFMVGLEEGLLPHNRSMETLTQLEEERRLAYVGITRAKQRLYMLYAFKRTFWGETKVSTPSRFLHDIPPDLASGIEKIKATTRMNSGESDWASAGRTPVGGGGRTSGGSGRGSSRDSGDAPTGRVFGGSGRSGSGGGGFNSRPPTPAAGGRSSTPPPTRSITPAPKTPTPAPRPAGTQQWKAGDKVRHSVFGEGIVVQSKISGADEEVTVAFAGQGVKRLLASIARLERV